MKLSKDKQINNVALIGILISVGFILALMDSSVIILILIDTFFIVYLVFPLNGNKIILLKINIQSDDIFRYPKPSQDEMQSTIEKLFE